MKITIPRKPLREALEKCRKLAIRKTTIPITNCVVIETLSGDVEEGGVPVRIKATDLETFLYIEMMATTVIRLAGEQDFSAAIPCGQLLKLAAALDGDEITIQVDTDDGRTGKGTSAVISSYGTTGKYALPVMQAAQFPTEKEDRGKISRPFTWNNDDGLIKRVLAGNTGNREKAGADSLDTSGVLFFFKIDGRFVAANTDGYAGAFEILPNSVCGLPNEEFPEFSIFIKEALLLSEMVGEIKVKVSPNNILCCGDGFSASFRRPENSKSEYIKGSFENISGMSEGFTSRVAVNKIDLIQAVNRVYISSQTAMQPGAKQIQPCIKLRIDDRLIVAGENDSSQTENTQTFEEISDVGFTGDAAEITFRPDLLKRLLAELGDVIEISYNPELVNSDGDLNIIMIEDQDNDDFRGFLAGVVASQVKARTE